MEMEYEWNDNKNRQNQSKHGIDFSGAIPVFLDKDRIEGDDSRHDYKENRYWTVGMVFNILLTVIYTPRNGRYRIISARRASKNEREADYNKKS